MWGLSETKSETHTNSILKSERFHPIVLHAPYPRVSIKFIREVACRQKMSKQRRFMQIWFIYSLGENQGSFLIFQNS